jgi:hypothetical protein
MKHLFLICLLSTSFIYAQNDVSLPQTSTPYLAPIVQEQSGGSKFKISDVFIAGLGATSLYGNTEKTMATGLDLAILETSHRFDNQWLVIGVVPLEVIFHSYKLTANEKSIMSNKYTVEEKTNGIVTATYPLEDITVVMYKFSLYTMVIYPEDRGFIVPFSKTLLRPFAGVGGFVDYLTTSITLDGGSTFGANIFGRIGMDILLTNKSVLDRDETGVFLRFEVISGIFPDFNHYFDYELRPVQGGQYMTLRVGMGGSLN